MKVMVIVKASKDSEAGKMPSEELLRDMGNFNEALVKAGIMVAGDGLYPSSQGARVRFSGKDRSVVNGPFAETKELIAGYWIWQVKSMDEAIAWVKRCPNPMEGESEIEIRRVFAPEDFAEQDPSGEVRAQEQRMIAEMDSYRLEGPRFEQGKDMMIAGLSRHYTAETRADIPALWKEFVPLRSKLQKQIGHDTYGVCYDEEGNGSFRYMAGVAVTDATQLPPGFTHIRIPAQRYAVFAHNKHASQFPQTFAAIFSKWLPNSGLQSAPGPFFERYTEDFCPDKDTGGMEAWIPIRK